MERFCYYYSTITLYILFAFCFSFNEAKAQNDEQRQDLEVSKLGMSINWAWSDAIGFDFIFGAIDRFHIGGTFQFSDAKGKEVDAILPNYGRTFLGEGEYYWTFDFGYSRIIRNLTLKGELNIGGTKRYRNYRDSRFTGDGYHTVSQGKQMKFGIGGQAGYLVSSHFEVFAGWNTLHLFQLGCRVRF